MSKNQPVKKQKKRAALQLQFSHLLQMTNAESRWIASVTGAAVAETLTLPLVSFQVFQELSI